MKYMNLYSIRPIIYLSNIFATAPIYNLKTQEYFCIKLHSFYATFVLLILTSMCIWSMQGRYRYNYKLMTTSAIVLDVLSFVTILILNCLSIIKLVLSSKNGFRKFFTSLMCFDRKSQIPTIESISWWFIFEITFCHAYFIIFCITDTMLWGTYFDISYYKYYLFRYVQYYQFIILTFLIAQYARLITDRYKHINDLLSKSSVILKPLSTWNEHSKVMEYNDEIQFSNVKRVHFLYTDLTNIVDLFNNIFGEMLFLFAFNIFIGLLEPLNIMLGQTMSVAVVNGLNGRKFVIFDTSLWAGLFLVSKT